MAVKKIPVPFCDVCQQPFLPKFILKDGTRNPIFDHPERSKRCGKCKRSNWNSGGLDRRRKPAKVESAESAPLADAIKVPVTLDSLERQAPQVTAADVAQTIDIQVAARRCKHRLFNCPECHRKPL